MKKILWKNPNKAMILEINKSETILEIATIKKYLVITTTSKRNYYRLDNLTTEQKELLTRNDWDLIDFIRTFDPIIDKPDMVIFHSLVQAYKEKENKKVNEITKYLSSLQIK